MGIYLFVFTSWWAARIKVFKMKRLLKCRSIFIKKFKAKTKLKMVQTWRRKSLQDSQLRGHRLWPRLIDHQPWQRQSAQIDAKIFQKSQGTFKVERDVGWTQGENQKDQDAKKIHRQRHQSAEKTFKKRAGRPHHDGAGAWAISRQDYQADRWL